MSPRLEITGLTVRDGRETVLASTDLTLAAGEIVACADPGGMMLRALAGFLPRGLSAGWTLRIDGTPVEGAAGFAEALKTGRIAFVPWNAERALSPHLPLSALFEEVPWETPAGPGEIQRRARAALVRMGLSLEPEKLAARAAELTRPARWRVALALATAAGPRVLLAEAPARDLDGTVRGAILARLAAWARNTGAAVLLTGQGGDGLAAIADRIVPVQEEPSDLNIRSEDVTDPDDQPRLTVRDLRVAVPVGRSLTGTVRWLTVIDGVNFEIDRGGSIAFLGESGSGKSMLARALARLARPTRGTITWRGKNLVTVPNDTMRGLRRDIQFLSSDPFEALDPLYRVGTQIEESLAELRPDLPPAERAGVVRAALETAGLAASAARAFPPSLTAAEAARAGLARALAVEPELLVCDEPLAKLGEEEAEALLATLLDLNRKGLMLVFATEHARWALAAARRILVLHGGHVVEDAPPVELERDARHPLSRALVALARGTVSDLEGDGTGRGGRGCPMRPRCPKSQAYCANSPPPLERIGSSHFVACHGWDEGDGDE